MPHILSGCYDANLKEQLTFLNHCSCLVSVQQQYLYKQNLKKKILIITLLYFSLDVMGNKI